MTVHRRMSNRRHRPNNGLPTIHYNIGCCRQPLLAQRWLYKKVVAREYIGECLIADIGPTLGCHLAEPNRHASAHIVGSRRRSISGQQGQCWHHTDAGTIPALNIGPTQVMLALSTRLAQFRADTGIKETLEQCRK